METVAYCILQWTPDKTGADFFFKPIYGAILSAKLLIQSFFCSLTTGEIEGLELYLKTDLCSDECNGCLRRVDVTYVFFKINLSDDFLFVLYDKLFLCKLKIIHLIWHILKFIQNLGCLLYS